MRGTWIGAQLDDDARHCARESVYYERSQVDWAALRPQRFKLMYLRVG